MCKELMKIETLLKFWGKKGMLALLLDTVALSASQMAQQVDLPPSLTPLVQSSGQHSGEEN